MRIDENAMFRFTKLSIDAILSALYLLFRELLIPKLEYYRIFVKRSLSHIWNICFFKNDEAWNT